MRFEIVTIFPEFFSGIFAHGIVRRALAEGLVSVGVHDLRGFTHDRHRTVDDRPFGGGEGMVLKPEPLAEALASLGIGPKSMRDANRDQGSGIRDQKATADPSTTPSAAADFAENDSGSRAPGFVSGHNFSCAESAEKELGALAPEPTRVILLSAQGCPFSQPLARELAALERVALICGRYEGVDERINELYCDMELSIGDYVLSGGELAAAVVVDAVMRLVPGVLGNKASAEFESFGAPDAEIEAGEAGVPRSQHGAGGLLDYPHYTRPAEFAGLRVPEALVNGDHQEIRRWRREQQLRKTLRNRPDLLERAALSQDDRELLEGLRRQRR